jgi:hypothetical protein
LASTIAERLTVGTSGRSGLNGTHAVFSLLDNARCVSVKIELKYKTMNFVIPSQNFRGGVRTGDKTLVGGGENTNSTLVEEAKSDRTLVGDNRKLLAPSTAPDRTLVKMDTAQRS